MGKSYLIALLITLLGAGTYWYQSEATVCPVPLAYRLGTIDPAFNLSPEQALIYIKKAEAIWENEVARELFRYDETAEFTIDFVFDERQATANSEEDQRENLDEQKIKNEKVLKMVESLQKKHKTLAVAYQKRIASYEQRLLEYNNKVARYNDQGGAPKEVFSALEKDRRALSGEAEELSVLVTELNALVVDINNLSSEGNDRVNDYNQKVGQYNTKFGFSKEFTQGDYQGDQIHVYKFSSEAEVVTVLAHEFGHALGIGHVEDPAALMYYLLEDTTELPILATDDKIVYQEVCGEAETLGQRVRRIIREF